MTVILIKKLNISVYNVPKFLTFFNSKHINCICIIQRQAIKTQLTRCDSNEQNGH